MRELLLFAVCFLSIACQAQPGTEVYLFDLNKTATGFELSNPINISVNEGYDNQPSFSKNGKYLYYTSWQSDNQTDIIQYELSSGEKKKISNSKGSEYSPIEMPGGKSVSTIILEKDGQQLLWRYDLKRKNRTVLVPNLVIGYHTWYDKKNLYSFVLGAPPTLQHHDLKSATNTIIEKSIGRSLHKIPNEKAISYISKASDEWRIMRYLVTSGEKSLITPTIPEAEDMCWTPSGEIIMGAKEKLFFWQAGADWQLIADFSNFGLEEITRLAANPTGNKLAVVVKDPR